MMPSTEDFVQRFQLYFTTQPNFYRKKQASNESHYLTFLRKPVHAMKFDGDKKNYRTKTLRNKLHCKNRFSFIKK